MELNELTRDEQLGLVALVEVIVSSNADVSDEEQDLIGKIAAALGDETYQALADEVDERFPDEAALKTFLAGLHREEARELIYGTALETAIPDVMDRHESSLLGWLATAWKITVQFDA